LVYCLALSIKVCRVRPHSLRCWNHWQKALL
jgi:hypothetical protein